MNAEKLTEYARQVDANMDIPASLDLFPSQMELVIKKLIFHYGVKHMMAHGLHPEHVAFEEATLIEDKAKNAVAHYERALFPAAAVEKAAAADAAGEVLTVNGWWNDLAAREKKSENDDEALTTSMINAVCQELP